MREAGDIEQDANIILGVWDELAGKISTLQEISTGSEKKLVEAEISANQTDIQKYKTKLENLKKLIEDTQEKSESSQDKWIKILKNRNGANNKTCKLKVAQFV